MSEVAGTAIVSVLPMVELNELMETGRCPVFSDDQQDIDGSASALP